MFKHTYFVKQKWTAAFENHDYLNSVHRIRELLYQKQSPRGVQAYNLIRKKALAQVFSCEFCEIFKNTFSYRTPPVAASVLWRSSFFVFQKEAFQFSKFHENVGKLDKGNFKRGLTMTFKVKNP